MCYNYFIIYGGILVMVSSLEEIEGVGPKTCSLFGKIGIYSVDAKQFLWLCRAVCGR